MAEENRCQYQSTNCENARARRDNGELHRLCEYHRDKANETQRRWHSRHKESSRSSGTPTKPPTAFERRALARLMADRENYRAARSVKRRRSATGPGDTLVIKSEPHGTSTTGASSHEQLIKCEVVESDHDSDLSDEDIEGLTALVMEYNTRQEPSSSADAEFVEMLDAWFHFTHRSVRQI